MTDEDLRRVERLIEPFRKFGRWFVTTRMVIWATGKTARWQTIMAVLVAVGIGFPLVANSIGVTNKHVTQVALQNAQNQLYFTQVIAYSQSVAAYRLCLDGVSRADQNRAQWQELVEIVAALDSGNGHALALADKIQHGPLLSSEPRTEDDCPTPSPLPVPPPSLGG